MGVSLHLSLPMSAVKGRDMYYVEEFGPDGDYRRGVFYDTEREAREQMIRQITEMVSVMEYDDKLEQIADYARALQDACYTSNAYMPNYEWVLVNSEDAR